MFGLIFCTLIAAFCIYLFFNSKNLTKRLEVAPTVKAKIIDCIKVDESDEVPYYKIVYEYSYKGEIYTFEDVSERKKTIDKEYKKLLLIYKNKEPVLVEPKILKENKESKGYFLIFFAILVELLGIFGFILEKYKTLGNQILYNFLIPTTGIVFVLIGINSLLKAIHKRKLLKIKETIVIPGKIIGFNKSISTDSKDTCFPIYECMIKNEKIRIEGTYNTEKPKGSKVNLYYNEKTGEIFEKQDIKSDLTIGITFTLLGFCAVISPFIALLN